MWPSRLRAGESLQPPRERASHTFLEHPVLRTSPRKDRRLSIMFSGYLYHHDPPQPDYAIMTNFQNFQSGQDDAEAWQQFSLSATRPVAGSSKCPVGPSVMKSTTSSLTTSTPS